MAKASHYGGYRAPSTSAHLILSTWPAMSVLLLLLLCPSRNEAFVLPLGAPHPTSSSAARPATGTWFLLESDAPPWRSQAALGASARSPFYLSAGVFEVSTETIGPAERTVCGCSLMQLLIFQRWLMMFVVFCPPSQVWSMTGHTSKVEGSSLIAVCSQLLAIGFRSQPAVRNQRQHPLIPGACTAHAEKWGFGSQSCRLLYS